MMKRKNSAFTLIELMIVVAIVGILSAVAYPSYQSHVLKSQRQVAQAALVSLSSSMERYYSENNNYIIYNFLNIQNHNNFFGKYLSLWVEI